MIWAAAIVHCPSPRPAARRLARQTIRRSFPAILLYVVVDWQGKIPYIHAVAKRWKDAHPKSRHIKAPLRIKRLPRIGRQDCQDPE